MDARAVPPVDERAVAPGLTLDQLAAIAGGYRWFEHSLFELTGTWAATAHAPAARVHLDEVSLQHAWHADLWGDRVPVLDRIDPDRLLRPPAPAFGTLVGAMAELTQAGRGDADVRRLAALYRVAIPRLLATYDQHLRETSPASDGPVIRVLRLVLRDEAESWQAGETLLQSLLTGPEQVAAASETQLALESLVVEAGAGAGLVAWPPEPGPSA